MIDNNNNNNNINSTTNEINYYDVLIVGCGPNGSLMANLLGQMGHKVLVVESSQTFTQVPKAAHLDDEGLRILNKVNLDNDILNQSYQLNVKFNKSFDGDSFTTIKPDITELNYPRSIFWYQPEFERSIRDGFKRFSKVELLTYHRVVSIEKYDNNSIGIPISNSFSSSISSSSSTSTSSLFSSSTSSFSSSTSSTNDNNSTSCSSCSSSPVLSSAAATITTNSSSSSTTTNLIKILNLNNNETKYVKCKFIIGADGGNSSIRKMMKSKLQGSSGKMRWLVVDAKLDSSHPALPNYFQFVCNPSRPALSLPIPGPEGQGHFRWEFVLFDHEDSKEMESDAVINQLLTQHMADLSKLEIIRKSVYTFQSRIANNWYDGDSTILIGDACHMVPPFLGLGVSSGFRDCSNLAWKLDLILRGGIISSPKDLLNTYQIERQPNIETITLKATQAGQIIMLTNKYKAFFRNIILKSILSIPPIEKLFQNKAGMKPENIIKQGVINNKLINNNNNNNNNDYDKLQLQFQKIIGIQITQPFIKLLSASTHSNDSILLDQVLGNQFSMFFLNFNTIGNIKHQKLIKKLLNNQLISNELKFNFINVIGYNQVISCDVDNNNNNNNNNNSQQLVQIQDNSNESIFNFIFNKSSNNQLPPTIVIIRPDKHIFSIYNNNNLKFSTILITLKDSLFIK